MPFNFRLPNHRYARRVAPGMRVPREPGPADGQVQAARPVWMAQEARTGALLQAFLSTALKSPGCTSSAAAIASTGMWALPYSAMRSIWRGVCFQALIDSECRSDARDIDPRGEHCRRLSKPRAARQSFGITRQLRPASKVPSLLQARACHARKRHGRGRVCWRSRPRFL